jgi:tricorn protease
MWSGDRVYFLSDRNGPMTLFYYDVKTKAVKEAIPNQGLDLKSASLGPDAIVCEQFGGIFTYDLKSGKTKPVAIRVQGDLPALRTRLVDVARRLGSPAVSPTGVRALFTARGDIISVPAEKGDARNLTNTPGVMERDPQWSPDGKNIAYLSDESGEYALHVRPQSGAGDVSKIELKAGFYRLPRFSPDSKKIALVDTFSRLSYVDLETKKQVEVAQDTYQMRNGDIAGAWSPDSKWLAYSKVLPNELSAIHLYSLADAKSTQMTDGLSDATNPVFDKDGKYLYFTASTNSGESLGLDIHAVGRTSTSSIYLAVLDKTQPSPFAPESDEEKAVDEKKTPDATKVDTSRSDTASGAAPPNGAKPAEPAKPKTGVADIKIDLDGIDQRILSMPLPPRRYTALQVGKAGTLLALEAPAAGGDGPAAVSGLTVHRYDLKARKNDVPLTGVNSFQMSAGGDKALYRQGENWIIAALRPMAAGPGGAATPPPAPPAGGAGMLKTAGIEVRIDPVQEWAQMYREAWRVERDWFYDRNMHGLDLKAAEKKYEPYLRNVASRDDLTWAQLMVVYQHHERLDGTGYPAGLEANEIHPWARLCAVADVFDAMTCHRPYRKAAGSKVACEHLKQRAGTAFDAEAVKYWTSQVGAAL